MIKQRKQKKFTFRQKKDNKELMTLNWFSIKMEFQKIVNLLDTTSDDKDLPRLITKTRIEVYDQSGGDYNVNKEIRIKAPC